MRVALICFALAGCVTADLVPCGDLACSADQECTSNGCVDRSRLDACDNLADNATCTVEGVVGTCRDGACTTQVCGDGVVDGLEECEGEQLGGATCLTFGFYDAPGLRCSSECRFDTSECVGTCGDTIVNGPELCDTTPGDVLRCSDIGFDYGSVTCSSALCAPLYSACATFGWRERSHMIDTPHWISTSRPGNAILGGYNVYYRLDAGTSQEISVPVDVCGATRKGWASSTGEVFIATDRGVCRNTAGGWVLDEIGSFHAIWGRSSTDVFATGAGIYHYDGTTWSEVVTGLPAGEYRELGGRGTTLVAVREDAMVAIAQGTAWTLEAIGATSLSSPWISPAGEIYLVDSDELHRRTASGWTRTAVPGENALFVWGLGERAIYVGNNAELWAYDLVSWMSVKLPFAVVGWSALGGSDTHITFAQPYQRFYESSGFLWSNSDPSVAALAGGQPLVWALDANRVVVVASDEARFIDGTTSQSYALGQVVHDLWGTETSVFAVGTMSLLVFDGSTWSPKAWNGCAGVNHVWGEAADRVYFAGAGHLCVWDGTTVTRLGSGPNDVEDMWGSATSGTYVATSSDVLLLTPNAPSTWSTLGAPAINPVALWGDANEILLTIDDGRIFRRAHGTSAWVPVPHELVDPITSLSGKTGDVLGVSVSQNNDTQLVRWDGVTWDAVASPTQLESPPRTVFSSSAGTWVAGPQTLVRMFRPR